MCGIVGLYNTDSACDGGLLAAMRDLITHRGPDDGDSFLSGPLGLGHRRLSIIDLAGGHQPMLTADGRYAIVFNGEIYNYKELQNDLRLAGVVFRTNSDTEVVLQLHAHLGDAAVSRLNGIFAYAIWDAHEHRLLLARDRAGIKPLYFCRSNRGIAFSSEIKSLFSSGLISPRLNEQHVGEYLLFRHVAGNQTLFKDVECLPPGHTMEIRAGRPSTPTQYWSVGSRVPAFTGSYDDAVDALDGVLNKAVTRQLMSEVPLGTFCSGGIDSSLTTAIASRHATKQINTFSVGFHEADYDESEYARLAASSCGTRHHELKISEAEYAEMLPKLIWHHDVPLNFANSVHIYAVSKLARQHVTVVLTGEGADELFGGYPRYYIPRLLQSVHRIPGFLRTPAFSLLSKLPDHRFRKLAHFAGQSLHDVLLFNCTGTDPALGKRLLGRHPVDLTAREEFLRLANGHTADPVSALATLDFQTYLVSILERQDKMSMATSIEARVPFLDNEIIDFARSLPIGFKQTLKHRKRVLKDVALRYLPPEIVTRRKSGFGVPLQPWFASGGPMGKLLKEAIHDDLLTSLLSPSVLNELHGQHVNGKADHSDLLWGMLNLQLWRRAYGA